jgi:hypothetical protein
MGGGGTQLLCATYANMKKSSKIFEKCLHFDEARAIITNACLSKAFTRR